MQLNYFQAEETCNKQKSSFKLMNVLKAWCWLGKSSLDVHDWLSVVFHVYDAFKLYLDCDVCLIRYYCSLTAQITEWRI